MRMAGFALCIAFALAGCSSEKVNSCAPAGLTTNGEALPDCSFTLLDGSTLRIPDDLRGTPTVLNFWASWCVACLDEMPAFDRIARRAGARLRVIGMDAVGVAGETESGGRTFARRLKVSYPIAFDRGGGLYYHFQRRPTLPITVFVDAEGVVANYHIGQLSEAEIAAGILEHLHIRI